MVRRRGQCRRRRAERRALARPPRLRAAGPRHRRRLRLGAAGEARPAGPRPGHLRRGPADQRRRSTASRPTATAATTRSGSASATTQSDDAPCRSSSPAARSSSPSPAKSSSSATLPHLLLGRPPARRRHRAARPLQAAGQAARPGPDRWCRRGRSRCTGPPTASGRPLGERGGAAPRRRLERRSWPAPASSSRPAPAPPRSCCRRAAPRSPAMLVALVLFPVLILGDQWHTAPDRRPARRHRPDRRPAGGRRGRRSARWPASSAAGRGCCRWRSSPRCRSGCRSTPAATRPTCWCRSTW